eukprot:1915562-Amphidinium_carterae.1
MRRVLHRIEDAIEEAHQSLALLYRGASGSCTLLADLFSHTSAHPVTDEGHVHLLTSITGTRTRGHAKPRGRPKRLSPALSAIILFLWQGSRKAEAKQDLLQESHETEAHKDGSMWGVQQSMKLNMCAAVLLGCVPTKSDRYCHGESSA